jgi:hypothetical protein
MQIEEMDWPNQPLVFAFIQVPWHGRATNQGVPATLGNGIDHPQPHLVELIGRGEIP